MHRRQRLAEPECWNEGTSQKLAKLHNVNKNVTSSLKRELNLLYGADS
jgi:hypothetical protein